MALSPICSIPDCGKPVLNGKRCLCNIHYLRWRRHGDPLGGKTIHGDPERHYQEVVLLYDGDECLTWPYNRTLKGAAMMPRKAGTKLVCRRLCEEINGPPPTPKHESAHSCGKGHLGCVTKKHLSWKTHAENMADKIIHGTTRRGKRVMADALTHP